MQGMKGLTSMQNARSEKLWRAITVTEAVSIALCFSLCFWKPSIKDCAVFLPKLILTHVWNLFDGNFYFSLHTSYCLCSCLFSRWEAQTIIRCGTGMRSKIIVPKVDNWNISLCMKYIHVYGMTNPPQKLVLHKKLLVNHCYNQYDHWTVKSQFCLTCLFVCAIVCL